MSYMMSCVYDIIYDVMCMWYDMFGVWYPRWYLHWFSPVQMRSRAGSNAARASSNATQFESNAGPPCRLRLSVCPGIKNLLLWFITPYQASRWMHSYYYALAFLPPSPPSSWISPPRSSCLGACWSDFGVRLYHSTLWQAYAWCSRSTQRRPPSSRPRQWHRRAPQQGWLRVYLQLLRTELVKHDPKKDGWEKQWYLRGPTWWTKEVLDSLLCRGCSL